MDKKGPQAIQASAYSPPKLAMPIRTDHVSKRGFLDRQYAGSPDETKSCVWEECSYFLVSFVMWV